MAMSVSAAERTSSLSLPNAHPPGSGDLHLASSSTRSTFSTLIASYPLKLLAPSPLPSQPSNVALVYTLAYGGGLVAGDVISLRVRVDERCGLVSLTQGSTKVFKRRPGMRPLSRRPQAIVIPSAAAKGQVPKEADTSVVLDDVEPIRQRLHVTLSPSSFLLLLPDSISPFRSSRFSQTQRFLLPECSTASLLILDWVNSGRGQRSNGNGKEVWSMDNYASTNEVFLGGRLIMRERMVLDNATGPGRARMGVAEQLAPYNVYATLLVIGPHVVGLIAELDKLADRTRQFQVQRPARLVWSWSPVEAGRGGVLRLAGEEVEEVRGWLRDVMGRGGIRELVGDGLWGRII